MAVEIPRASPEALDKYVAIEGATDISDVSRALRVNGEIVYEAEFGDTHTELVSMLFLVSKMLSRVAIQSTTNTLM